MAGVTVVARLKAKSGMENELKKELMALVEPSRTDAGCINYDLHQSSEDSSLFLFYENWSSRAELDGHLGRPHLKAFLGKADGLLAEPIQIEILDMISTPA